MDASFEREDQSKLEDSNLSYKFQRLRERLRQGISTGELSGKLPGERALAKQYHVNAKTLSKALTDLAAEGLLDRNIGRGTFVKGSAPASLSSKRWLILCDEDQVGIELISLFHELHGDLEVTTDISAIRPSFLNQFSAVIDIGRNTPDTFLRDLVVRNVAVVAVGKEPRTYSTHAVAFDGPRAIAELGRKLLMLGGHRKLAAVEPRTSSVVADTLRQTATRYAAEVSVESCLPREVGTMVEHGVSAFVCDSVEFAAETKKQLERLGVAIPQRVSVAAIGPSAEDHPVSGYFISRKEKVAAVVQLLTEQTAGRPITLWLTGKFFDHGTISTLSGIEAPPILNEAMSSSDHAAA